MGRMQTVTRSQVVDRLWNAIMSPDTDDPRKIVRACEVILKSMPEENTTMRESPTARSFLEALVK